MKIIDKFEEDLKKDFRELRYSNTSNSYKTSKGKTTVLRAYELSKSRYETDIIVFTDIMEKDTLEIILEYLNQNNINEIIIADESIALATTLRFFLSIGAEIENIEVKPKYKYDVSFEGFKLAW